jgi:hypothetical protein
MTFKKSVDVREVDKADEGTANTKDHDLKPVSSFWQMKTKKCYRFIQKRESVKNKARTK